MPPLISSQRQHEIDSLHGVLLNRNFHTRIAAAARMLHGAKRIYVCGNGGSAATASHFAQDLRAMGLKAAYCMSDNTPFLTAVANDHGYIHPFAQFLVAEDAKGPADILVAISCSGNSKNVLGALFYASRHRMGVVALTGLITPGGNLLARKLEEECPDSILIEAAIEGIRWQENIHMIACHLMIEEMTAGTFFSAGNEEVAK